MDALDIKYSHDFDPITGDFELTFDNMWNPTGVQSYFEVALCEDITNLGRNSIFIGMSMYSGLFFTHIIANFDTGQGYDSATCGPSSCTGQLIGLEFGKDYTYKFSKTGQSWTLSVYDKAANTQKGEVSGTFTGSFGTFKTIFMGNWHHGHQTSANGKLDNIAVLVQGCDPETNECLPVEEWSNAYGGPNDDYARSVNVTRDGGYIVTGATASYGSGDYDVLLMKINSSGRVQWSAAFGGSDNEYGNCVQQTDDGGYIIAGDRSPVGGDDATYDALLIKTDPEGNHQWNKTFGGSQGDLFHSVKQTKDGGYIISGWTRSPEFGAQYADAWLLKTDSQGNQTWSKIYGGPLHEEALSVQQTNDGEYILTGFTSSFGAGSNDAWLLKTSSNGTELWNKTFGGPNRDDADSGQPTRDGGYILAGHSASGDDLESWDVWLVKADSVGNLLWSKTYGGPNWDEARSVQETDDCGYIIAGQTESYGAGDRDVWVIKTDSKGDQIWNMTSGRSSWDMGWDVQETNDGYIIAGDTTSFGAGGKDALLIKLNKSGNAPSILVEPVSQTKCLGEQVNFTVTATGSEPLTHQWFKDGQAIGDATSPTYAVDSVNLSDAGSYWVNVSNPCGSITSEAAILAVSIAPSIIVEPVNQTKCEGEPANFTVTATGSEPITYQWLKNGKAIYGASSPIYAINNVDPCDAGSYSVNVSNPCGTVSSGAAALVVYSLPTILVEPINQTKCEGEQISFTVAATGSEPLTYQWFKEGREISGATSPTYILDRVNLSDAGSYSAIASNPCGSVTSDTATLKVNAAPTILIEPVNQIKCEGEQVSFIVAATGSEPLTYQWLKDGQAISGATLPTYNINSVNLSDAGSYALRVSNPCGSVTSDSALLTVNTIPNIVAHPLSQTRCSGESATFNVTVAGYSGQTTIFEDDFSSCPDADWTSDPTSTNDSKYIECASDGTVHFHTHRGKVQKMYHSLDSLGNDLELSVDAMVEDFDANGFIFIGFTKNISDLDGYWKGFGFNINHYGGQDFAQVMIFYDDGPLHSSYANEGILNVERGKWHTYKLSRIGNSWKLDQYDGDILLGTIKGDFIKPLSPFKYILFGNGDTTQWETADGKIDNLRLQTASSVSLTYQWLKDGQAIGGATSPIYTINDVNISDGGSYSVRVSNACGSVTSNSAILAVNSIPTIVDQPLNQTKCLSEQANFSVMAIGSEPLTYQWFKDGQAIEDATSPTYNLSNSRGEDAGNYTAMIGNPCGSVTSAEAKLVVYVCIDLDIKPGSCPNPINVKSKGVFPAAILGSSEFDVTTIDPETIILTRDGFDGVRPIRYNYEDVGTPFQGVLCNCTDLDGDGYMDMTFKFDTQTLVNNRGLLDASQMETIELDVKGSLLEENGATPIKGQDCVLVKGLAK